MKKLISITPPLSAFHPTSLEFGVLESIKRKVIAYLPKWVSKKMDMGVFDTLLSKWIVKLTNNTTTPFKISDLKISGRTYPHYDLACYYYEFKVKMGKEKFGYMFKPGVPFGLRPVEEGKPKWYLIVKRNTKEGKITWSDGSSSVGSFSFWKFKGIATLRNGETIHRFGNTDIRDTMKLADGTFIEGEISTFRLLSSLWTIKGTVRYPNGQEETGKFSYDEKTQKLVKLPDRWKWPFSRYDSGGVLEMPLLEGPKKPTDSE